MRVNNLILKKLYLNRFQGFKDIHNEFTRKSEVVGGMYLMNCLVPGKYFIGSQSKSQVTIKFDYH